jgi:predicted N-acyltransferase
MPQLTFRYLTSMKDVRAAQWDALEPRQLLTSHAWLAALEDSGIVGRDKILALRIPALADASGRLVAAAPGMLKRSTLGDFGPENLWIRDAGRQGINLLPKLQLEVAPAGFSVGKLLVTPDLPHAEVSDLLVRAMIDTAHAGGLETLTLSRIAPADVATARRLDLVISHEIGTRWHNQGYARFDDFLARMKSDYRVAINGERRAFRAHGYTVRELRGNQITSAHWDAFYRGYEAVCRKRNSSTRFPRAFLDRMGALGDAVWLFGVFSGDTMRSSSYALQCGDTLYAGHWSELAFTPNAVFEVGLYRPVEIAIEQGLKFVHQGVWGPHKPKRGFEPVAMSNAHWFRNSQVRAMAQVWCEKHRQVVDAHNTPSWSTRYLRPEANADASLRKSHAALQDGREQ